ncbi:MauE/DoxX family redox-associated membrane protein [Streptomyces sp. NPDC102406]|uniref:MauE/DoxX family redox-associated membrane protein n=1 Tax=Streptomyces sp. NPDC102406 TaxID=3366171 RepID=UPI0037F3CCCC
MRYAVRAATAGPAARARMWPWAGTAARLLLAGVLGYAGLVKIQDLANAERSVAVYQIVQGGAAQLVGGALPFIEVALALLLLAGLGTRVAATATATLMAVYITAIASVWARGLSIDCGCFGGGGTLADGAVRGYAVDIARDLLFLGAAVLLIRHPRTRYALDRRVLDTHDSGGNQRHGVHGHGHGDGQGEGRGRGQGEGRGQAGGRGREALASARHGQHQQ